MPFFIIFLKRYACLSLFISLLCVGVISSESEAQQKRIIEDFEDVGTWRQREGKGQLPRAWFAAQIFLGGSALEVRNGTHVGELRYVPDPSVMPPYRFGFERVKASLLTATPDGIEFDAHPKGKAVTFRFVLRDATRRAFTTEQVRVFGDAWQSYRIELNATTVPGWKDVNFPVSMHRVIMETSSSVAGSVFIDDLAFTGEFAPADQLVIKPIYSGISYTPGLPVTLSYRVWNALPQPLNAIIRARLHTAEGRFLTEKEIPLTLAAVGETKLNFPLGVLPIGAYQMDVVLEAGTLRSVYDDVFGVFKPNGRRINRRPMWMGVQDQAIWESEAERRLHLEWSKQLGSDADRIAGGGSRLEYYNGRWAFDGWKTILHDYEKAGIDVLFTFFELPSWMTVDPKRNRTPPKDMMRFERHAAEFGRFISTQSAVKYVQFWNEPDSGGPNVSHGFFHGTKDDFLTMFETFSRGFRSENKVTKLTTGGLTLGDEIAGVSRGSIIEHAADYDIVAFHAHGSLENYEDKQLKVEKWLTESNVKKHVLNSESGERSGYTRSGRFMQAVTLVKKLAYAKSRPLSELYLWFTLQDYWDMDPETDDSFGLVTSDNRAKPSFIAYNELIRQLANTDPAGEVDLHPAVRVLRFRRDDGTFVYVCWLKQGETSARLWLKVGGARLSVTDMFGQSFSPRTYNGTTFLSLGEGPIYLSAGVMELSIASDRDIFIRSPGSIVIDGAKGGQLPVDFTGPSGRPTSGHIFLQDEKGDAIWDEPITVMNNRVAATVVPIPPMRGNTVERNLNLKIAWGIDETRDSVQLPVRVLSAYPIQRLSEGNPFTTKQALEIEKLPVITLDQVENVVEFAFDPSIRPWQGPEDLSVQARIAYNSKGIYLRFDVIDDKHVQTSYPSRLDRGDSIQVGIAGRDGVTLFFLGLRDNGENVVWCSRSPDENLVGRWDTPLRIMRTNSTTRYEAYVPADRLGLEPFTAGQTLRFSFNVNEDDGQRPDRWQRRVRYLRWQNGVGNEPDRLGYGIIK